MILTEITINSTLRRISLGGVELTNWWDNKVISYGILQQQTAYHQGGYCRPQIGNLYLSPKLFEDDWPPPLSSPITIKHTATTEGAAETLFEGTAHMAAFDRQNVKCRVLAESYSKYSSDTLDDTLTNVFSWACDASRLNLTLDSTNARSPSPAVKYTASDRILIDLLSDVAAFFNHLFYISGSTLYLVDMQTDNGTQALEEFDFGAVQYKYLDPAGYLVASPGAVSSSYAYGKELALTPYHDTESNIETALSDIEASIHAPRACVPMPFEGSLPAPGKKLSWTDTSLAYDIAAWVRVRNIQFMLDISQIVIEGEGALS